MTETNERCGNAFCQKCNAAVTYDDPVEISSNDYGTPVLLVRECVGCGHSFTVCPVSPEKWWDMEAGCQGETCVTYDINRDIDLIWDQMQGDLERISND